MAHECGLDGTPCFHLRGCYQHLKDLRRAGGRLSDDELIFIGYGPTTHSSAGGWRSANLGLATFELSAWEIDTTTAADMAALMSVGTRRDGIEFVSDGWY